MYMYIFIHIYICIYLCMKNTAMRGQGVSDFQVWLDSSINAEFVVQHPAHIDRTTHGSKNLG